MLCSSSRITFCNSFSTYKQARASSQTVAKGAIKQVHAATSCAESIPGGVPSNAEVRFNLFAGIPLMLQRRWQAVVQPLLLASSEQLLPWLALPETSATGQCGLGSALEACSGYLSSLWSPETSRLQYFRRASSKSRVLMMLYCLIKLEQIMKEIPCQIKHKAIKHTTLVM